MLLLAAAAARLHNMTPVAASYTVHNIGVEHTSVMPTPN